MLASSPQCWQSVSWRLCVGAQHLLVYILHILLLTSACHSHAFSMRHTYLCFSMCVSNCDHDDASASIIGYDVVMISIKCVFENY